MTDNETWLTVLACAGWLAFVVAWLYADAVAGVADRCITLLEECRRARDEAYSRIAVTVNEHDAACDDYENALGEADKQIAKLRWRINPRQRSLVTNAVIGLELAASARGMKHAPMHAQDMMVARVNREQAHAAGQGVP